MDQSGSMRPPARLPLGRQPKACPAHLPSMPSAAACSLSHLSWLLSLSSHVGVSQDHRLHRLLGSKSLPQGLAWGNLQNAGG